MFVAAFAVYVVVAVWALILFHLRREMEENYLIKHSAQAPSQKVGVGRILGSRRVVGGSFLRRDGGDGGGWCWSARSRSSCWSRASAPGFARRGDAHVGQRRRLRRRDRRSAATERAPRTAHDVVLRATLPRSRRSTSRRDRRRRRAVLPRRRLRRLRGRALGPQPQARAAHASSSCDGARFWIGEPDGTGGRARTLDAHRPAGDRGDRDPGVGAGRDRPPARVRAAGGQLGAAGALRVFPRWSGEAALRVGGGDGDTFITLSHAHYVAYSRSTGRDGAPGRARRAVRRRGARGLPGGAARTSRRRLANLAATLGRAATPDDADTIAAVTRALRAKHGYTLEPQPAARRASTRSRASCSASAPGHCELFASAAVLLLRVRGVPARYVTGFRGGEWNGVGGYVAVRDDRAHAWAEAFVPDSGWVRVDATPPGPPPARAGTLSEVMDALDYFWNRWVVGYDLGRQLELARRAGRHLAAPRRARVARAHRGDRRRRRAWLPAAGAGRAPAAAAARARGARRARRDAAARVWTAPRLGADRSPVSADAGAARARRLAAPAATRRRTSTRSACARLGPDRRATASTS